MSTSSLPDKPLIASPCNHCGLCCRLELCQIGKMAFPQAEAPCPALRVENGRALCEIVLMESAMPVVKPLIARSLGIGTGCSMSDDDTTDAEFLDFHAASRAKLGMI